MPETQPPPNGAIVQIHGNTELVNPGPEFENFLFRIRNSRIGSLLIKEEPFSARIWLKRDNSIKRPYVTVWSWLKIRRVLRVP